jgi:hypothetical protein
MGTTARLLMIYACVAPKVEVFKVRSKKSELEKELVSGLQQICKVIGQMNWEPEVVLELQKWINDDCKPIPTHSKLQHYLSRRWLYVLKLAMVSAMSDGMRMTIELKDFLRAKLWLFDAEASMPDIFRDMAGRSDSQVLQDMHFFMWSQYARDKKPIHESRVYNWLTTRAHADKIKYIIETAERSGMITRTGLGQLIPRPKHEHGEE